MEHFRNLPNQVSEPNTTDKPPTPDISHYPSFPSLSSLISPHPSPLSSPLLFDHSPCYNVGFRAFDNSYRLPHIIVIPPPVTVLHHTGIISKPHHDLISTQLPPSPNNSTCCFSQV